MKNYFRLGKKNKIDIRSVKSRLMTMAVVVSASGLIVVNLIISIIK